jgi:four helix bundle protein
MDMTEKVAARGFRNLILWQKAQGLASEVVRAISVMPRDRSSDALCSQLVRSAGSVPANIAEGYGRYSDAAYRNHLSIARGSLFETQSWLDLLGRTGHLQKPEVDRLLALSEEVSRLLTAAIRPLRTTRTTNKEESVKQ